VVLYSLGGTIAMTKQDDGTVVPALSGDQLVGAVPALADLDVTLDVREFRQLPGASLSFDDLRELAREIAMAEADGIVVTQGTDTIEETAYFLDLLYEDDRPIVVTGAMRNASQAGSDGPANILAAVRVAASLETRGIGCVVVFAEEIHAACFVAKVHTSSPAAFASYPGPIGYVAEERVVVWSKPRPQGTISPRTSQVRTAVATVGLGDDGAVLDAIGGVVDGLVVAAFGAGHVPAACVQVLADLAKTKPVILASRTGRGPVLAHTYGFPGSESDLLARGLIGAGSLNPTKARVLLHALLMAETPQSEIGGAFGDAEPIALNEPA
jgi:L-asparaginase